MSNDTYFVVLEYKDYEGSYVDIKSFFKEDLEEWLLDNPEIACGKDPNIKMVVIKGQWVAVNPKEIEIVKKFEVIP
jgi:hypothetical protein